MPIPPNIRRMFSFSLRLISLSLKAIVGFSYTNLAIAFDKSKPDVNAKILGA